MIRPSAWLLPILITGCVERVRFSDAEAARIHRSCSERIASDGELTRRGGDVGVLPTDRATSEVVVIYGATWCRACHLAADYLERHGIPFAELNVDLNPGARDRMNRTLEAAALPNRHSLPVIEVRGTVMIGFLPCVLEAAWRG